VREWENYWRERGRKELAEIKSGKNKIALSLALARIKTLHFGSTVMVLQPTLRKSDSSPFGIFAF
jgi:hypothetical protein